MPPAPVFTDTAFPELPAFNAQMATVALLDRHGKVILVNESWRRFAEENNALGTYGAGVDYLALCDSVCGPDRPVAAKVAAAIREILAGNRQSFTVDYPCHSPSSRRWFRLMASAAHTDRERQAIVMHVDITEHLRAQCDVQYQAQLLAAVHDAVYATDMQFRVTIWNRAAESLYGWSLEEALGRNIHDLVGFPLSEEQLVRVRADLDSGVAFRDDATHVTRDGRRIAVHVVAIPIQGAGGERIGYVTTVSDQTDRNLARIAAWENAARLQLASRAATEAICDVDLRTGDVWRSQGYESLFGYRTEDVKPSIGWWLNRIHPEDVERLWNVAATMLEQRTSFSTDYRFRRADGSYAFVLHRAFVLLNEEGDPVRVMGTLIDITERKRTEQALAQSEKRYRLLADNSTDMIARIDRQGLILYASPATHSLLGYSADEVVGRRFLEFIHPDDLAFVQQAMRQGTREPLTIVCRVRLKNGEYTWFESIARTLFDPANPDAHEAIMVSRDVSARKQAEDLVRLQQAELAHISRVTAMGEMASGIAHELNQPLTTISHYADACLTVTANGEPAVDRVRAWARKIAEQAERAGDIIRRVKGFVQKTSPERRNNDPAQLLAEVIELLDPDARLHDIDLQFEATPPLPIVSVDKVQIQQVLVNLLRNAFESLESCQAMDRRVIVRAAAPGPRPGEVIVSVEDHGAGISDEGLQRLFEPFFTTKPDGTGVGLPISRSIVEDHGGRLWAANNPDRGMTFWFTLPTAYGVRYDGPQAARLRRRRRSRSARSATFDVGNDGS